MPEINGFGFNEMYERFPNLLTLIPELPTYNVYTSIYHYNYKDNYNCNDKALILSKMPLYICNNFQKKNQIILKMLGIASSRFTVDEIGGV